MSWNVFPGSILSQLHLSDCNDTVKGVCPTGLSLQECIRECSENGCKTGYFVRTANQTYCAPLREYSATQTSPYYRLRDKSVYPELRDMQTFVFSKFPYPPNLPNVMFYTDHFVLEHIDTTPHENAILPYNPGLYLGQSGEDAVMTKASPVHVQFLPEKVSQGNVESYVYVKNGDSLVVNIPKTSYVLRDGKWIMRAGVDNAEKNTLKITCPNKKLGEILDYDDRVYFQANSGSFLSVDASAKHIGNSSTPSLFQLVPKVQVYYCDGSACKGISLDQTTRKGISATYRGQPIQRNPTCWGLCKTEGKGDLLLLIIVLILFSLAAVRFMKTFQS